MSHSAKDHSVASPKRVTRRKSSPSSPSLPGSLGKEASREVNLRVATILEVLGGLRTPSEAAAVLGISVNSYYLIERKALAGLLASCAPKPKGPREPGIEKKLAALERELETCRRECLRQAAWVRATQRALGLPAVPSRAAKPAGKSAAGKSAAGKKPTSKRRQRPTVRALRAAATLRRNSAGAKNADGLENRPVTTVDARTIAKEQDGDTQGQETVGGRPCRAPVGIEAGQAAARDDS